MVYLRFGIHSHGGLGVFVVLHGMPYVIDPPPYIRPLSPRRLCSEWVTVHLNGDYDGVQEQCAREQLYSLY